MTIERVAKRFQLGEPATDPVRVPGGLSNELWRVTTQAGVFAIKRMVVDADRPDFAGRVEAAFAVEQRARAAGVPMPEPVPAPRTGRALAEVGGSLFRVHRWVDGRPGAGSARAAADLVARIHAAGNPRRAAAPEPEWAAERWDAEVAALARRVSSAPDWLLVVDSHRDLDRKNTLLSPAAVLMALDWDAAGPASAVSDAVGVALDWSDGDPMVFADALRAYHRRSGVEIPAQPWIFAGWVAAQGGWLDYNATYRGDSPLGRAEVAATLARLRELAADLDLLLAAM
jgi:hypothetical protein